MSEGNRLSHDLELSVSRGDGRFALVVVGDLAVSAAVELPGLHASLDHAHARANLTLDLLARSVQWELPKLERPTGMDAGLELPGVTGGGYLARVDNQWRGALQAALGPVSVTGFGILDTDPFGLIVVMAAEFTPPIQLSFGFTLVGVGGIVGINRRPQRDRISAAVASGDLSKVLFPRDPVAEADRLLPVLNDCFPAHDGGFVVGPMLKLGWGTPTVIAATIAVLAADDAVTVVGRIAVSLPAEAAPLIHLEATVLGRADASGLAIDASLANSHIVGVPIEGDIKVRVRPTGGGFFAFAAGGFHPAFPVPEGMGGMRRIGAHLSPGPILDIRLEGYLAITTGSVQFGARVDLRAGFGGFGIRGHAAFDALFLFDPFRFEASLDACISVECASFDVASIRLRGELGGPTPWRVRGHASISILWWDVDIDLPEITWGERAAVGLPPARDPIAVLLRQLEDPAAWSATSHVVPQLVRLQPQVRPGCTVVHPLAELGFRQRAIPLGIEMRRMDAVPLSAPVTLKVAVQGGEEFPLAGPEAFVPGQFLELDDADRVSSSGYTTAFGGFDVLPADHDAGTAVSKDEAYETTVLERTERPLVVGALPLRNGTLRDVGHSAAIADTPSVKVAISDPAAVRVASRFTLADSTNVVIGDVVGVVGVVGIVFDAGRARAALRTKSDGADLQVVPAWEVG